MARKTYSPISRRGFLQHTGALGGSALIASQAAAQPSAADQALPRRVLGRTDLEVSVLGLGTWPSGRSETVDIPAVIRLVHETLDLGINFVDAARGYKKAEEGIGKALRGKRDKVVLTTKVWADTAEEAQASLEESLRLLETDYVDILYMHSVGNRDVQRALAPGGSLEFLLKQKEAGKVRAIGISGHNNPEKFLPLIRTGQIDVVLMAMNFVDRYIYGFEEKVLPVAREHNMGIVCMKVYGGMRGRFADADGPNKGSQVQAPLREQAVRYAMGLPGVGSLIIGPHTVEQLRQNVTFVKRYKPLTPAEQKALAELGRQLKEEWGDHYV
jgi:predicted aldo/keto reductase-like oxidoreductase